LVSLQTCRRHYPGGTAKPVASRFPLLGQEACASRRRPSPYRRRVGSRILLFEACSAFTRVTACLLAESPCDPLTSKAPTVSLPPLPLRLLPAGATSCRVGLAPTKNQHLSRRTAEYRVREDGRTEVREDGSSGGRKYGVSKPVQLLCSFCQGPALRDRRWQWDLITCILLFDRPPVSGGDHFTETLRADQTP